MGRGWWRREWDTDTSSSSADVEMVLYLHRKSFNEVYET